MGSKGYTRFGDLSCGLTVQSACIPAQWLRTPNGIAVAFPVRSFAVPLAPQPLCPVSEHCGEGGSPPRTRVSLIQTPPLPPSMPFEYPGIRPPALAGDALWSERFLTPSRCWPRHWPLSRWPIDDPCKGEGGWMHHAAVWCSRRRGIRPSHPLGPCAGFSAFHCGLPRQPQHGAHRGSLE